MPLPKDPKTGEDIFVAPPEWWSEYYCALGEFIFKFARAEQSLNALIGSYLSRRLGGSDLVRALSQGNSLEYARQLFRRILIVTDAPPKMLEEVEAVLKHFMQIREMRNLLVHNGAGFELSMGDRWLIASDGIVVKDRDKEEVIYFQLSVLGHMSRDLHVVPTRLDFAVSPGVLAAVEKTEAGRRHVKDVNEPWHYRPEDKKYADRWLKKSGPKHDPALRRRPKLKTK